MDVKCVIVLLLVGFVPKDIISIKVYVCNVSETAHNVFLLQVVLNALRDFTKLLINFVVVASNIVLLALLSLIV